MYRHIFLNRKPLPELFNFITMLKIENAKKNRSAEIAEGSISLAINEPKIKLPDINKEKTIIKLWLLAFRWRIEFFIFMALIRTVLANPNSTLGKMVWQSQKLLTLSVIVE
jgi:hypothetical protein